MVPTLKRQGDIDWFSVVSRRLRDVFSGFSSPSPPGERIFSGAGVSESFLDFSKNWTLFKEIMAIF